ncbi:hypothetical protein ACFRNJ_23605 [Streptomyces sp. NPDC056721]|uniref:hypothetical protein n=1 Tax=unclassified Streptomyces TaxID=2593676 RepID=UPI00367D58A9
MAWQVPDDAVADEGEQVRYFTELLDVFEEEGVDTALWFTFAGYSKARGAGPRLLRRRPDARRDPLGTEGGIPHDGGQVPP